MYNLFFYFVLFLFSIFVFLKTIAYAKYEKDIQNTKIGDIVAKKDGVITRIVPEDGTAMLNEKSYVQKGNVVIQGTMFSKIIEPFDVPAKGIVKADCSYNFEKDYLYNKTEKKYTNKTKYTIGITINNKENMLNYLNKDKKYDISKRAKKIKIFGQEISFDLYKCVEYEDIKISKTKEELISQSQKDVDEYLDKEILPNTENGILVNKEVEQIDIEGGFKTKVTYIVNEEIGEFVERNESIVNEQVTN